MFCFYFSTAFERNQLTKVSKIFFGENNDGPERNE
jgi:hypothetical protein